MALFGDGLRSRMGGMRRSAHAALAGSPERTAAMSLRTLIPFPEAPRGLKALRPATPHDQEHPMYGSEAHAETASARETVGVFQDPASLQSAIDSLLSSGFHRADLSLLARREAVEEKLGHAYRKVQELEDVPGVPSSAYVSPEAIGDAKGALIATLAYLGAAGSAGAVVASGGTLAAAIAAGAIAGSTGGSVGAMLARLVDHDRADRIDEQLERGGLLLWVRTRDAGREERAVGILRRNGAADVHGHDLASPAAGPARQTAAQPRDPVDDAGRESFPASDAPSFGRVVVGAPRRG
jgi:hypothetical protein